MGKKRFILESDRPHAILEMMLDGARVPEGFICDGCTSSPDLHFVWACNIHDYDSSKLSDNWRLLEIAVTKMGGDFDPEIMVQGFSVYDSAFGEYIEMTLPLKQAFETWRRQFKEANIRLKENISILSRWKIVDSKLVKRPIYDPKRFFGYRLSRLYARATGNWFTSWAE